MASEPDRRGATYTLWMLMAVYTISFLDRQIVSILAQDIKLDLGLSDTQLGVLTGLAFAVFYATLGIPIAALADRVSRVPIISVCLALWSLMTVVSGMATNFAHLALARMGVGVGEAGALPCSHSIIADAVPPEKRSSAMAIFQLGVPAGVLFGFLIGGWVNEWSGWRMALVIVGAPGLVFALLLFLTVKEPKRGRFSSGVEGDGVRAKSPFWRQLRALLARPSYIFLGLATTLASMGGYCILAWAPTLLIREHGLSTGVLGTMLSLMVGVGGLVGTYVVGLLGDMSARRHVRGPIWLCMWITLLTAPLFVAGFLARDLETSLIFLIPAYIVFLAWMGPNWAMVQAVSPERTRAMASAVILLATNLIGLGLGPMLVGVLSDRFEGAGMPHPLAWALVASLCTFPLAALCYVIAALTFHRGARDVYAASSGPATA